MLSVSAAAAAAGLTQFKLGYNCFAVLKACLRPAPSQSLWEMQILTLLLPDPLHQHLWGGSRLLYFHQPFRVFFTWTFENHSVISVSLFWDIVSSLQKSCKNNTKVSRTPLAQSLEKAIATYSSTLAWKIPWTEEPGRLQSMGSLRVGYDWATSLSLFTFMHWRRKWQPTPVFLPGESQGWGSLVGCRLWGCTESDTTEVT